MHNEFPTVDSLNFAYGPPLGKALLKQTPEDFCVYEILHYELTDEGEHLYLHIEKEGLNTQDVKMALSKALKVPLKSMAEAGLKDKHAKTRQWISVHWPIKTPLPILEPSEGFKVLEMRRHIKKLKKGAFGHNAFTIMLHDVEADQALVNERLDKIHQHGFANYYGAQRFGRHQSNLTNFLSLIEGGKVKHHAKSLAISAARSFLFNQMLSLLIERNGWPLDPITHGLLWGRAQKGVKEELDEVASFVTNQYTQLCTGLEKLGLELSFRLLSVKPSNLKWKWFGSNQLQIEFCLPPGCFATALLRELFNLEEQICES